MKYRLFISFLLLTALSLRAQSYMVLSNEDFGSRLTMFLDSEAYPMKAIDKEIIRITYDCFWGFQEEQSGGKGKTITMQLGNEMVVIAGETIPSEGINAKYILQVGSSYSKFLSTSRYSSDSVFFNGGKASQAARFFSEKANAMFSQDCYYIGQKNHKLCFTGRLAADDFSYDEDLESIRWTIRDSCIVICNSLCRLAIGEFRGQKYKAWFAEDIPISAGPWKLGGLPGIILKAEDDIGIVRFSATNIEIGGETILKTDYPYISISRKQYFKLLKQMREDPALFSSMHTSRSAAVVVINENHRPNPLPLMATLEHL